MLCWGHSYLKGLHLSRGSTMGWTLLNSLTNFSQCSTPHRWIEHLMFNRPPTENTIGLKIRSNSRDLNVTSRRTGHVGTTTEFTQKRKPWQRPTDAWSAPIALAKKHAPQESTSVSSSTRYRTRTTTALQRPSSAITLLGFLVEDCVLLVNCVPPLVTPIGSKEVPLKLASFRNSLSRYSRKWMSNKYATPTSNRYQRMFATWRSL